MRHAENRVPLEQLHRCNIGRDSPYKSTGCSCVRASRSFQLQNSDRAATPHFNTAKVGAKMAR